MRAPVVSVVVALAVGLAAGWLARGEPEAPGVAPSPSASPSPPAEPSPIPRGQRSLFFVPFFGDYVSEGAREAGRKVVRALHGDEGACAEALADFDRLEKVEGYGGDLPALRFVCEYLLADEENRAALRASTREADRFLRFFEPEGFARLARHLELKYGGERAPRNAGQFLFHEEFLRFNSPTRETWERAGALVDVVAPKEGEVVADVGAGTGFYAWRFAERVGASGKVYAVELSPLHLGYLRQVVEEEGIANVEAVEGVEGGTGLPERSADVVFLCLLYQAIYGTVDPAARVAFVESVKKTLKPGGRLVVVESVPADEIAPGVVPFGGFSISRDLVVPQLEAFGFRLLREERWVPQRYVLVFEAP
ncbi:MAG: class I SAM-dependent methyltransferase [Myxococcota bacterium]